MVDFESLWPVVMRVKSIFVKGILAIGVLVLVSAVFINIIFSPQQSGQDSVPDVHDKVRADIIQRQQAYDTLTRQEKSELDKEKKVYCEIVGEFCHEDPKTITLEDKQRSLSYKISTFIALPLLYPPASGIETAASAISGAGLIPGSYAATGFGFQVLSPFKAIWTQIRNVAFAIMVLIILIEAFAVMFRTKLDSKDSINIENYIPQIIAVLILIQLSFAIAGFLIDIMYVSIMLIYFTLAPLMPQNAQVDYQSFLARYFFGNPYNLFSTILGALTGNLGGKTLGFDTSGLETTGALYQTIPHDIIFMFGNEIGFLIIGIIDFFVVKWLFGVIGGGGFQMLGRLFARGAGGAAAALGAGGAVAGVIGVLVGGAIAYKIPILIVGFILFLIILYVTFQVFVMMLRAYIMILLLTIFAPLYILMTLVPGNSFGIQLWLKSLISELVVYPVVFGFIFTLSAINKASQNLTTTASSTISLPFVPAVNAGFMFLIGLVGISLLPKFVDAIRGLIARSAFGDLSSHAQQALSGPRMIVNRFVGGAAGISAAAGRFRHARQQAAPATPGAGGGTP
jgi:hypothetical protein